MDLRKIRQEAPAWRVHRDPTALPNFHQDGETRPNRFDDPQREYRVRYFASNKRGAFLEVLARFRTNDETQARLEKIAGVDEKAEPKTKVGFVPGAFLRAQQEVTGLVADPKHEFIDVAAPETLAALNRHADVCRALERSGETAAGARPELNENTIRLPGSKGRPITQAVSRVVFDETDAVGLRYTSRLDAAEPCWAIFDWVKMRFSAPSPINLQDVDLKAAAASLGLTLP